MNTRILGTGVNVIPLISHVDDRGTLIEILRSDWPCFTKFGQVYMVRDASAEIVRAFHRHFKMYDWFYIANGSAKFVFVKDEPKTVKGFVYDIITVGRDNPCLLVIPPEIWHGWMSLEPNTILISTASEVYNQDEPDEERCSPTAFDFVPRGGLKWPTKNSFWDITRK